MPCSGWETMRSVSASPSASLAARVSEGRHASGSSRPTRVAHRRGGSGLPLRCRGRCGRRSSRPGSRARSAWCRTPSSACGRPARATARCRGSRRRGRPGRRRCSCSAASAWRLDPRRAERVHAVRTAGDRVAATVGVAGGALAEHAVVPLERDALQVVVGVRAGEHRRASSRGRPRTARPPWPVGEAVEREPGGRHVRVGREGGVDRLARRAGGVEDARCSGSGRCCAVAVPVWQLWQAGSSSQPVRAGGAHRRSCRRGSSGTAWRGCRPRRRRAPWRRAGSGSPSRDGSGSRRSGCSTRRAACR